MAVPSVPPKLIATAGLAALLWAPGLAAHAQTESVLYSFPGLARGAYPVGGVDHVAALGGSVYGATGFGGKGKVGVVYRVTAAGSEKVLHTFTGGADGLYPWGGLIDVNGVFYGTTAYGGGSGCAGAGCGTVFRITPAGVETVLFAFQGGADGAVPIAGLVADTAGNLYGTTTQGGGTGCGGNGCGTVFSLTPAGVETVLYSFQGSPDGQNPSSPLVYRNGLLFGTTAAGGSAGCGIAFSLSTHLHETVLHTFLGGKTDGCAPNGLTELSGTLYGTAYTGGLFDRGIAFGLSAAGTETVLHSFGRGTSDSWYPHAPLLPLNGTFYGTTDSGGAGKAGTVFSLTPAGSATVLHSFGVTPGDGAGTVLKQYPFSSVSGLTEVGGTLVGTTHYGGAVNRGTVFQLTP